MLITWPGAGAAGRVTAFQSENERLSPCPDSYSG